MLRRYSIEKLMTMMHSILKICVKKILKFKQKEKSGIQYTKFLKIKNFCFRESWDILKCQCPTDGLYQNLATVTIVLLTNILFSFGISFWQITRLAVERRKEENMLSFYFINKFTWSHFHFLKPKNH